MKPPFRSMRRRSRRFRYAAGSAALALLAVLAYGFAIEPARLVERDYRIPLRGWPAQCDGLRLDVVADTHTGSPHNGIDNLDRVVRRLLASDSDAVLLAGDYVILSVLAGTYVPPREIAEHLRPLAERKPVYAVLGNHDWWKNGREVATQLHAAGVHMIDNRAARLSLRGCDFWLVGLGDLLEGGPDPARAFGQVADAAPAIALTHEPDLWPRIRERAVLTVAGHTHGGQIHPWPRRQPGRFTLHSHLLGGWIVDRGRTLFVSPGIGTSILPMRLGVPPEISRLTLRSEAAGAPDAAPAP